MAKVREKIYYVPGMHCASCELIIEKKLLRVKGVKLAQADTSSGRVTIEYDQKPPEIELLNTLFISDGYIFFSTPQQQTKEPLKNYLYAILIAIAVVVIFLLLNKSGLIGLVNVSAKSSLPAFFFFGLVAGISSCAALVGGLLLSLSKQWSEIYDNKTKFTKRITPHLLFNSGRLISFALLGALLGFIGEKISLSFSFAAILVIVVALIMIILGLQMLGLRYFNRFQITAPKFITHYASSKKNFKGKYLPFVVGALTFFLPCGFTLAAQSLALLSGNPLQGGLIMLVFALGTLPMLLIIGLTSTKLLSLPHWSSIFVKTAGILVIVFALYNLNAQFAVFGWKNLGSVNILPQRDRKGESAVGDGLPQIIDGKQIIRMEADSRGYKPNYFKVRVNLPVRWEIIDTGTSGCTNAILARSLFPDPIQLSPGKTSIQEFTPTATGSFRFSCWMGMVNGTIEVVDYKNPAVSSTPEAIISNSAAGCGCSQKN